jgi:hypothetical protein
MTRLRLPSPAGEGLGVRAEFMALRSNLDLKGATPLNLVGSNRPCG